MPNRDLKNITPIAGKGFPPMQLGRCSGRFCSRLSFMNEVGGWVIADLAAFSSELRKRAMTIGVSVSKVSALDEWDYWYDERYNMISLTRTASLLPRTTLQGAYSLIIDADAAKIISCFETVTSAEITYWQVVPSLAVPAAEMGCVHVVRDFDDGQPQAYFTDAAYSVFYTRLGPAIEPACLRHIAIGPQVIVDIAEDSLLAGVWLLDLPPEIGQKHAPSHKAL